MKQRFLKVINMNYILSVQITEKNYRSSTTIIHFRIFQESVLGQRCKHKFEFTDGTCHWCLWNAIRSERHLFV